jgi:hypothetical protein
MPTFSAFMEEVVNSLVKHAYVIVLIGTQQPPQAQQPSPLFGSPVFQEAFNLVYSFFVSLIPEHPQEAM